MKIRGLVIVASVLLSAQAFGSEVVRTRAQCWSQGLGLRQSGGDRVPVHSRLSFSINNKDGKVSLDYIGHVETSYNFDNSEAGYEVADYYGSFVGKEHPASLSPRARTYSDANYYRFNDFDATTTSSHDGGGMWGYLVVSKKYDDKNVESFDAHYVFSAGDHMGGTVDYTCKRD